MNAKLAFGVEVVPSPDKNYLLVYRQEIVTVLLDICTS